MLRWFRVMFKIVPSVVYKDSFLGTEMGEEVILAS